MGSRERETSLALGEMGGLIEQMADVWREERLQQMLHRERIVKKGSAIRVVDQATLEGPLSLPKLFRRDRGEATPRFGPNGEIGIPVWREVRAEVDGERHFLPGTKDKDYVQFTRPGEKRVDFNNLPNRLIKKLTMQFSPDIDSAIRQTFHIRKAYSSGEEARQLKTIWRGISRAWGLILKRQVNKENLGQLAEETALALAEAGLPEAEKTAKVNIQTRLSKVFTRDSLGRLNPLVQRIRLRSAFLEAVGLEAFSILVHEKFSKIWAILMMERETTRQSLAAALESLDTMMGFTKRGASVFEGKQSKERETEGLEAAVYETVLLLNRARVAPFLQKSRAAAIALWGCREEKVEVNKKVIGEVAEVLLNPEFVSVKQLLKEKRFDEAKELVRQWVFDPLTDLIKKTEEVPDIADEETT